MRRRLLSLAMALSMALSLLPAAALATGETQEPEQEAQIPVSENGTEGVGEDATIPDETGDETDTSDETETTVITTPTVTPTETTPVETLTPVVQEIGASDVAAIGDQGYSTLDAAIEKVASGETIVLQGPIDGCEKVTINRPGVTFTIDFKNQSLNSVSDTWAIEVQAGTVTLRDGKVQGAYGGISCSAGAHVTLQDMTVSKTKTTGEKGDLSAIENSGTMVIKSGAYNTAEGTFAPTILNLAEMTIEGGTFETGATDDGWSVMICRGGANTVITGGSFVNNVGYGITCSSGANVEFGGTASVIAQAPALGGNNTNAQENFTVTGGTLVSRQSAAIFFPAEGKLEISGGTITGLTGIHALMGDIEISGGTITGTAIESDIEAGYPGSGSGPRSNGSALLLVSNWYKESATGDIGLRVNITGGTFTSAESAEAIDHMMPANPNSAEFTCTVRGGTFYNAAPDEKYIPVGYQIDGTGPWTVRESANGEMEVTPPETSDGSASATMDGVYTGTTTKVEGGSTGTTGEEDTGNRNGNVTVNLTTGSNTTSTTLTVTASAAESLDAANSLTVVTDSGSVSLDNTALDKIAGNVTSASVEITIQETTISTQGVAASYRVSVQSGAKDLLPSGEANGTITITVPSPAVGQTASAYQAWYVTDTDGNLSYREKLTIADTEDGRLAITIGHLSDIVLLDAAGITPGIVAKIVGGSSFTTLRDAIEMAQDGQTVQLLQSVQLPSRIVVSGKSITLDLNNCTISRSAENTNAWLLGVAPDGGLIIKDSGTAGKIDGTRSDAIGYGVLTNGSLTVQSGTITGGYGIFVSSANASADASATIQGGTVSGSTIAILVSPKAMLEVTGGTVAVTDAESSTGEAIKAQFESTVKLSGGTIQGGQSASGSTMGSAVSALGSSVEISGNAQLSGYSGVSLYNLRKLADGRGVLDNGAGAISSKLEMAGGSINTKLYAVTGNNLQSACSTATISGGTITTTEGAAIYWPMEGNLTITGTAKVTGPVAIEIKMGTLNIRDSAELTGTAEYKAPDSSGTTGDGIAEADGSALRVSAEKYGNAGQYTQYINSPDLTVTVTGGTFTSTYGNAIAVYNTEAEANTSSLKVTGGTLTPAAGRAAVAYISEKTPTTATNSNVTSGEMTTTKTKTTVTVSQDAAKAAVTTAGTTSFYNTIDEAIKAASDTAQTAANGEIEVAVFGNGSISAANLALEDNIKLTVAANVELTIPVTSAESGLVVAAFTDTKGNTVYQLVSAISPGDIYVAQITSSDGTTAYYSDLPAAVKSVQNGQTIVLTKKVDAGTITVSRPVTFTIDPGNTGSTYTIQAGTGYVLYQTGNTYTISVYTPPVTPDNDTPSYSGGSSSEPSYSNTIEASDGGTVKVSPRTPEAGDTVTITPDPDAGYEVDEVIVTDRNGDAVRVTANRNGTYTFEQPRGRVTIEVTFVRTDSGLPFIDVAANAWYYDAVAYAYENGLMSGTASNLFSPNATTTRGMIVTMLYRLEGEPRVTTGSAFDDVADGMYYADAVIWANANGIVTGYDEATFGPNDAITREQMAAILYRYAQYKGYDTTQGGMAIREYADYEEISEYALTAMDWAVNAGLVTGTTSSTLTPDGSAVRAQVATIFMRFMEDVAG